MDNYLWAVVIVSIAIVLSVAFGIYLGKKAGKRLTEYNDAKLNKALKDDLARMHKPLTDPSEPFGGNLRNSVSPGRASMVGSHVQQAAPSHKLTNNHGSKGTVSYKRHDLDFDEDLDDLMSFERDGDDLDRDFQNNWEAQQREREPHADVAEAAMLGTAAIVGGAAASIVLDESDLEPLETIEEVSKRFHETAAEPSPEPEVPSYTSDTSSGSDSYDGE